MFYTYHQNNSGGWFHSPALYVIIEADNAQQANARAEVNGLYFDGVDEGQDCDCCGDRWSRTWSNEGTQEPSIGGKPLTENYKTEDDWYIESWAKEAGAYAVVFYADRTQKKY